MRLYEDVETFFLLLLPKQDNGTTIYRAVSYLVLGIVSRFCANMTPTDLRDLGVFGAWYLRASGACPPQGMKDDYIQI
jgi:hypothetical protein